MALASTTMLSSLGAMQFFASEAAAQDGDDAGHKALVCVFLFGGNDAWNMVIPTEPTEYSIYDTARGDFALLPNGDDPLRGPYLPLQLAPGSPNATRDDNTPRSYALHPAMPQVQQLFNNRHASFVASVGTLATQMTKEQYIDAKNGANNLPIPRALFSHSDQQTQWRNGRTDINPPDGWAGRFGTSVSGLNNSDVPMHLSLAGNNNWQANGDEGLYTIGPGGSVTLLGANNGPNNFNRIRFEHQVGGSVTPVEESFVGQDWGNDLKAHYIDQMQRTVSLDSAFSDAFGNALGGIIGNPNIPTMDANFLESSLRAVAASIQAAPALGMRRQVFYLGLGSFDHHNELLNNHTEKLGVVDAALGKFHTALEQIGAQDQVVTFTASEFSRTLKSNGKGTDHGWGGISLVMGGDVDGGRIVGTYPDDLSLGGPADVENNGRILPTVSVDEMGSELARWFGVPAAHIPTVFPTAEEFFDPAVDDRPVGFIAVEEPPADDLVEVTQTCFGTPTKGRFDIDITNNGDVARTYRIEFTGLAPRTVGPVPPGATERETYTSRPDGLYTVVVVDPVRNEQIFSQSDFVVDCFQPVPWELTQSCLAGRGRIDLWVHNETDFQAEFTVTYKHDTYGPLTRTRTLEGGQIERVTVTGRQYGTWGIAVTRNGGIEEVFTAQVDVLCGLPNQPIVIRRSCAVGGVPGARGRVDADLWNNTDTTVQRRLVVQRTNNPLLGRQVRNVTLAPDERATLTVSGRSNVTHDVVVFDPTVTGAGPDGEELEARVFTFDC